MTFAAPLWWWLLVPLIPGILALHVRRRRDVGVSSLRLWIDAGAVSGPRARLRFAPPKPSWALALQMLALVLIVGALARPTVPASTIDHVVLLIDASDAMAARDVEPDRMTAASEWATREVGRIDAASRVTIVRVGPDPDLLVVRADPSTSRSHLGSIQRAGGRADWVEAVRTIDAVVRDRESTIVKSFVAVGTSSQVASVLRTLETDDLMVEPPSVVGSATSNVGLRDVRIVHGEDGPVVRGQVEAFGEVEGTVVVELAFQRSGSEALLPWADVELRPRPSAPAEFEVDADFPGSGLVRVGLPGDAYPTDDSAWLAFASDLRPFRVLRVGPADPALERALGAVGGLEAFESAELPEDTSAFDLVVVTGGADDRSPETSTLWWGVAPPDADVVDDAVDPATAGDASLSPAFTLVAGRLDHPLAVGVDDLALALPEARTTASLPGADVLLADGLDRPLIQARTTRFGREVVVGFDPAASSWPSQSTFPAFVAAVVGWSRFPTQSVVCHVAAACRLPRDAATGAGTIVDGDGKVVAGPVSSVASGHVDVWPLGTLERRFVPSAPGTYVWQGPEGARPVLVHAVPVDAVAPGANDQAGDGAPVVEDVRSTERDVRSFWWLALVAVLLVEVLLAGLGEERFLRPTLARLRGPAGRRVLRTWIGLVVLSAVLLASWARAPLFSPHRTPARVPVVTIPDTDVGREELRAFLDDVGVADDDAVVTLAPTRLTDRASVLDPRSDVVASGPADAGLALNLASAVARSSGSDQVALRTDVRASRDVGGAFDHVMEWQTRGRDLLLGATLIPRPPAGPRITGIDIPDRVRVGERFEVGVRVSVDGPVEGTVRIQRDGDQVGQRPVTLRAGTTRVPMTVEVDEAGWFRWSAELETGEGVTTFVHSAAVRPAPNVRIVTGQSGAGHTFAGLLEVQGVSSDVVVPVDMPWEVGGWTEFDAGVLLNVPALDLHSQQQMSLQSWIRDEGGGLMILGGQNTFGPGGYVRTPLDEVSPLSSEVQREAPEVAMVFVLDRSGSMQQRVGGVSRLEIAKEATSAALDLLGERSFVGIVAFDEVATTVVPMTPVTERATIEAGLARLQANGGTSILPALESAYETIEASDSATRHIVLFTDGLSQPGDFGTVLARFRRDEISLSTVGIGQGTDAAQLSALARDGGGTFHQTNDFRALPGILAQEALLLSGSPIEEGTVQPEWVQPGQLFDAFAMEPPPTLGGYVATTAKPESTLHLVVDEQPLLASWTYGLGRVLAFTSQGAGPWSDAWLAWSDAPALWADALGWIASQTGSGPQVRAARYGDEVRVRIEVTDAADGTTAWRLFEATVGDDGNGVRFDEIAPGTFEAQWPFEQLGDVALEVRGPDGFVDEIVIAAPAWASDRPADVLVLEQDWGALARLSGGTARQASERADDVGGAVWRWSSRSAPTTWLLLATVLWLASLANRYLVVPRSWRRRREAS